MNEWLGAQNDDEYDITWAHVHVADRLRRQIRSGKGCPLEIINWPCTRVIPVFTIFVRGQGHPDDAEYPQSAIQYDVA